jgi:hypothetical protein
MVQDVCEERARYLSVGLTFPAYPDARSSINRILDSFRCANLMERYNTSDLGLAAVSNF